MFSNSLNGFSYLRDTITLSEYDNTLYDLSTGYTYSGLTFILDYENFTTYFDTTGFTYENIILTNDTYSYTGLTNEVHYFEITNFNDAPYIDPLINLTEEEVITGFTENILNCSLKLYIPPKCCPQSLPLDNKPWVYKFDTGGGVNNCGSIIEQRNEKGCTLDFIFNRSGLTWNEGGIFYYLGVRGDNNPEKYADNNLSFGFTNDGRIKWNKVHYTSSGFKVVSGQTESLCVTDNTKDFDVTITFERNYTLTECSLYNEGGINDLITGGTLNGTELQIMTGDTPNYVYTEVLSQKWLNERQYRLGTLKIYLNSVPIYKLKNWEEVIPSKRGIQPFIQSWGGGTGEMNNVHKGVCKFNIKNIEYYDEPLNFITIKKQFTEKYTNYDFEICGDICYDSLVNINTPTPTPIPTETPTPTPTSTPIPPEP
jgi:hypothetical protein